MTLSLRSNCPLCHAEEKTRRYANEDEWWAADCQTCGVPMFVWRSHTFPNEYEQDALVKQAEKMFPGKRLDMERRQIENHWHFHCR